MSTDSPNRVIVGKTVSLRVSPRLCMILLIHAGSDDTHKRSDEYEIRPDLTT